MRKESIPEYTSEKTNIMFVFPRYVTGNVQFFSQIITGATENPYGIVSRYHGITWTDQLHENYSVAELFRLNQAVSELLKRDQNPAFQFFHAEIYFRRLIFCEKRIRKFRSIRLSEY